MADVSDVQNALVSLIGATLYPNGTAAPSAIGALCQIFPGWPPSDQINAALAKGFVLVSINPSNTARNVTRYGTDWRVISIPAPTLSVSIGPSGTTATIAGSVQVPQNVGVVVNNAPFFYGVQASDTLQTIAAALAALITAGGITASSSGAVVTIPGSKHLSGRVGTIGTSVREVGRIDRLFQVTVWAPTPALRDAAGRVLTPSLFGTDRLTIADGTGARLRYMRETQADDGAKDMLYRRDLYFSIEYAMIQTRTDVQVLGVSCNIYAGNSPLGFGLPDPTLPFVETVTY